jgi:hypothetical protein
MPYRSWGSQCMSARSGSTSPPGRRIHSRALRDRFHPGKSPGHTGNGNGEAFGSKNNAADASLLPSLPLKGGALTISTPRPGTDLTQITRNAAQLRWCHTELFGHQVISYLLTVGNSAHHDRRRTHHPPKRPGVVAVG